MSIERVSRQAACLADPDRVQLLALLLSDPRGQCSAESLAGPGAAEPARVRGHLEAMASAGLLDRVSDGVHLAYRPTHDALTRFGSLLGVPARGRRVDAPEPMLERIREQLVAQFEGSLSAETVRQFVDESYRLLEARAHVRTYLPVLTARFAADRLGALVHSGTPNHGERVDVLFVCVHNAGRSQLAAAALRARARTDILVRTAGSSPAGRIDPAVLAVIERRGWSQALEFPKPLTDEIVRASDYVITMGCGDACPVVAGRTYLDWQLNDPAGRAVADVEVIADDVDRRVRRLLDVIGAAR